MSGCELCDAVSVIRHTYPPGGDIIKGLFAAIDRPAERLRRVPAVAQQVGVALADVLGYVFPMGSSDRRIGFIGAQRHRVAQRRQAVAMQWITCAVRRALAFAVMFALILAPVIIAATHGPGLPTNSALSAENILHGHSHDVPKPGQSGIAHDATDHEHQTQLILTQGSDAVIPFGALRLGMSEVLASSLPPSGLRRPPKTLSV